MLPLVLVWLAAHALLLGLILGLKFLGAKTVLLLAMIGMALWLVAARKPGPRLPRPV